MLKTTVTLLIIICLLASISSFLAAKFINQKEIIRAKDEMEKLRIDRDNIQKEIAIKDSVTAVYENQVIELEESIAALHRIRQQLEVQRDQAIKKAFSLVKPDSIMEKMKEFWPEMARSGWGFEDIYNSEYGVYIEYFLEKWYNGIVIKCSFFS